MKWMLPPSIRHMRTLPNRRADMNSTTAIILLTAVLELSGCGWSQEAYQASIRKECSDRGLVDDTPAFRECFAKELHSDHAPEPGAKGVRDHGWKHDLE